MVVCGLISICFMFNHYVSSTSFQRTVVFIRVETVPGENLFLRGGKFYVSFWHVQLLPDAVCTRVTEEML